MPRLCERPGCSAPASVAYGFEAERFLVWVESVPVDLAAEIRSGVLCRRHADALSPPRGWWLDDRRDPTPQLFREQQRAAEPTDFGASNDTTQESAPRVRRRSDKRSRRDADITIELPFDFAAAAAIDEPDVVAAAGAIAPLATIADEAGGEALNIAEPSPDVAPSSVAEPSPQVASSADVASLAVELVDLPDPDETKAIPWSPHFDQNDDLGGLLNVRSPLLSRAFRGRRGSAER
jgi:hypothetical protein